VGRRRSRGSGGLITEGHAREALQINQHGFFGPLTRLHLKAVAACTICRKPRPFGRLAHGLVAAVRNLLGAMAFASLAVMAQASRAARSPPGSRPVVGIPFTSPCTGFFLLEQRETAQPGSTLRSAKVNRVGANVDGRDHGAAPAAGSRRGLGGWHPIRKGPAPTPAFSFCPLRANWQPPKNSQNARSTTGSQP